MCAGRDAGIDLDADFGVRREVEAFAGVGEEVFDLFGRKIGGCAAAPVELRHRAIAGDAAGDVINFFFQDAQVRRSAAFILAG